MVLVLRFLQGGGGYSVGAVADGWGFGWACAVPALAGTGATVLLAAPARPVRRGRAPAPAGRG